MIAPVDTAGVIARPPLLYLTALAAGVGLGFVWPMPLELGRWSWIAGGALIVLGPAFMAGAMLRFRRAGTNVETWRPTTALVVDGPYRLSRNPIYVALTLAYVGIGLIAGNVWVLALAAPLLAVMRYGVIAREEAYLERKFGASYLAYKAAVRRWL
jgi:protein-S-isoprenylcysteine O-methyltransferase Ste14